MEKKVINKASTRERKLYQRDKSMIDEYYSQNFDKEAKSLDIQLNMHGYTPLRKK
jgi:hypothetical protein